MERAVGGGARGRRGGRRRRARHVAGAGGAPSGCRAAAGAFGCCHWLWHMPSVGACIARAAPGQIACGAATLCTLRDRARCCSRRAHPPRLAPPPPKKNRPRSAAPAQNGRTAPAAARPATRPTATTWCAAGPAPATTAQPAARRCAGAWASTSSARAPASSTRDTGAHKPQESRWALHIGSGRVAHCMWNWHEGGPGPCEARPMRGFHSDLSF